MATDIIRRSVKGSALNHAEMDQNLESHSMTVDNKTGNYTVLVTDQNKLIEMNGASITLTLCTVATAAGADTDSFHIWVKNIHTSSLTVDGNGAETIDGAASITLLENEGVLLCLSGAGTEWTILATTNASLLGITSTAIEINKLDGTTFSTAEVNYVTGVTSAIQTQIDAKLVIASNLSDLANAGTARTNMGVAIGSDVQAYDADLAAIAALAKTDGNFIVANGSAWIAESGATARASLGVIIGTDVQAYDAQLADLAGLAVTDGNFIVGDGANWVAESGATARTSLGLGSLAIQSTIDETDMDWANSAGMTQGALESLLGNSTASAWGTDIDSTYMYIPPNATSLEYKMRGDAAATGTIHMRLHTDTNDGTDMTVSGGVDDWASGVGTLTISDKSGWTLVSSEAYGVASGSNDVLDIVWRFI